MGAIFVAGFRQNFEGFMNQLVVLGASAFFKVLTGLFEELTDLRIVGSSVVLVGFAGGSGCGLGLCILFGSFGIRFGHDIII
jgi:hypothetical protein